MSANTARRVERVDLGERSYDVLVGRGAVASLAELVPASARRALVVTQPGIPVDVDPGIPADVVEIGIGEHHKSLSTIEEICRTAARCGLTRND